jgi:hypothetical protein
MFISGAVQKKKKKKKKSHKRIKKRKDIYLHKNLREKAFQHGWKKKTKIRIKKRD